MQSFKALGLLQADIKIAPRAWSDLARSALQSLYDRPVPQDITEVLQPEYASEELWEALTWLGIVPGTSPPLSIALPKQPTAPIDLFAAVLAHKLRYLPGERDLVLLHHEIVAQSPGEPGWVDEEIHSSSLVAYGTSEASAMSRCVGLPLAFAVRAVLDGTVATRGVCDPGAERAVWGSVLAGLEEVGLGMRETVKRRRVGQGEGGIVEQALARKV